MLDVSHREVLLGNYFCVYTKKTLTPFGWDLPLNFVWDKGFRILRKMNPEKTSEPDFFWVKIKIIRSRTLILLASRDFAKGSIYSIFF